LKPFHFKKFTIHQSNSALKVGTDAMVLGTLVKANNPQNILDIGTGNGVLALMMAQKFPNAKITGIDNDSLSLLDCSKNFEGSEWKNRLSFSEISIFHFKNSSKFDLIVCNPPFYETTLQSENARVANSKHCTKQFIKELITKSFELLKENGNFWIIYPFLTASEIESYSRSIGYFIKHKITVFAKPNIEKRMIYCLSKEEMVTIIEESILLRNENNQYSDEYKELTFDFHAAGTWK